MLDLFKGRYWSNYKIKLRTISLLLRINLFQGGGGMKKRYFNLCIILTVAFLFLISFHVEAQPKIKPGERKEILDPSLKITSFRINNGAASTTKETVTLNNTVQGNAGEYRASMSQDFTNAQWRTYSTAPTFNLGGDHGTKTIYFQVKSSRGVSNVVSDSIRLEAPPPQPIPGSGPGPGPIVTPTPQPYPKTEPPRPPTITSFKINNGEATTTSRFVTLRSTVRGEVTHFRVSSIGDTFPGEEWIAHYSNEQGYSLITDNIKRGEGNGLKTIYLQVKDSLGQVSSVARASITLNEPPPALVITSFKINDGAPTTSSRTVTLNNTAPGAEEYCAGFRTSEMGPWKPYSNAPTFMLLGHNGRQTVYFQVKSRQDGFSDIVSDTIILADPEIIISFKINSGATRTTSRVVTLNIVSLHPLDGNRYYRASESREALNSSAWLPYRGGVDPTFTLSPVNGRKVVLLQMKDDYCPASNIVSAAITLDAPPEK
jgi:hypothetical protein